MTIALLGLLLLLALNTLISYLNARAAGEIWIEARAAGGMTRLLAWCVAGMSEARWFKAGLRRWAEPHKDRPLDTGYETE